YMSEERYGALRNDVDIFRTFEGDNTVLRLLVAKNRLTGMARHFNSLSGVGKLTAGAHMALRAKMARFNESKGRTDESHLLDPEFQRQIFIKREQAMLLDLSQKLRKLSGKDGAEAAQNQCQNDMIAYAEAYADRMMMTRFADVVQQQQDPE